MNCIIFWHAERTEWTDLFRTCLKNVILSEAKDLYARSERPIGREACPDR